MNILFMKWNGLGNEDMTESMTTLGHKVTPFPFSDKELHNDPVIEKSMKDAIAASDSQIRSAPASTSAPRFPRSSR